MKRVFPDSVEKGRVRSGHGASEPGRRAGIFALRSPHGERMLVIANSAEEQQEDVPGEKMLWDHVSASCHNRCPTWEEMCFIKDLFFDPDELVLQFHPPKSKYVNTHPYALHLWKPKDVQIPLPPMVCV